MRRLALFCLVLLHLHAGAAPSGAIVLWPGAPPGGAAPGPQRDSVQGSITQVEQPYLIAHRDTTHAKKELLGAHPAQAARDALSVELHVDARTPPTFIAQALDDPISPPENSTVMAAAQRRAGVPVELHQFRRGGHGWMPQAPG